MLIFTFGCISIDSNNLLLNCNVYVLFKFRFLACISLLCVHAYTLPMEFSLEMMHFFIETHRRNGTKCTEIHTLLINAWPNDCPSLRRIQQLCREFEQGDRDSFSRVIGSGRPTSELRNNSRELVQQAINADPDLSLPDLATQLNLSESMVYRIITDDLDNQWMHTRWVPHILTDHNKQCRIECCTNLIE